MTIVYGAYPMARIVYRKEKNLHGGFVLGPEKKEDGTCIGFSALIIDRGSMFGMMLYGGAATDFKHVLLDRSKCVVVAWDKLDELKPDEWAVVEGMYTTEVK